jgi:hypothetical protein
LCGGTNEGKEEPRVTKLEEDIDIAHVRGRPRPWVNARPHARARVEGRGVSLRPDRTDKRCFTCHKRGHFARECNRRQGREQRAKLRPDEEECTAVDRRSASGS